MTATTSQLNELLYPGLNRIFGLNYKLRPIEYDGLFKDITSNKAYENYQEITGLGLARRKVEGTNTEYDLPIQGYKTTLVNVTMSLGFKVTREMKDDDQYNQINKMPAELGKSVIETVNILAANIFNNSFNTSALYAGADGKPLCSATHPLVGGGTSTNVLATTADLNMDSFEQVRIDIKNFVDSRGKKMLVKGVTLLSPPSLERKAKEILNSSDSPYTAERATNVFKNDMTQRTMQYLVDPKAWFVITDAEGLLCQKRVWPAEFKNDNVFDADVAAFKTYFRKAFGWYDFRNVFGVPGA